MIGSRGGSSGVVASDDLRTWSQCMSLEPIVIGDQVIWYDEVRRVMGIPVGSTAEKNSFGAAAAHVKPSPPMAVMKDLKRFRFSVFNTCVKARNRVDIMDERLHRLDKYCDAVASKKQQRSELSINDRSGAITMKMGTQIHSINQRVEDRPKNIHNINQRVEDRPKNILLNKRVRTSVAESRAECQSNGLRKAMAKDGNFVEDNGGGESDLCEKIRKLAAGGEGWDKKVKRKRSAGTVFTRSIDNEGVPKRALQNKFVEERGLQHHDAHISRLGSSNGTGGSNKFDTTSLPNNPSTLLSPKIEQGAPILPRDRSVGSNKERIITKENNHHKRPMAQWAGQRPQKKARARRSNLVSPALKQDEKQLSFESFSPSEIGVRLASNGSPISRNATNNPHKLIVKLENVQSPLQREESIGGESRLHYEEMRSSKVDVISFRNSGPSVTLAKKNNKKAAINEESGNSVWRQGRSNGRGLSIPQSLQSSKKNGSKPGRRLKKLSDRKGISHHVPLQNNSSPDYKGVSNDDREDLLEAVNHARIATHLACSSPFWKKMEPLFSSVSSEDKAFLSQQVHENCLSDVHMQRDDKDRRHDMDETSNGFNIPLYQRVLSALVIEDDIDEVEEQDSRNTLLQTPFCVSTTFPVHPKKSFTSNGAIDSSRSDYSICEDKLLQELQSIGLCLDPLPDLDDKENETIQHEVDKLKTQLRQQEAKKKVYLSKIHKDVGSSTSGNLETLALDRLVELAHRKLLATGRGSRSGIQKVPKQFALAFGRRTLARCRKFEKTGKSCFNDPPFHDILFAPIENDPEPVSDEGFGVSGPISNRGKKKEVFLDDVGTKGKRSPHGDRKTKAKQKMGQLPTTPSDNEFVKNKVTTHPVQPSLYRTSQLTNTRKDVEELVIDPMVEELDIGGAQDLNSFLNFDEQDIDEDFAGGLDIPMDDLTDLF